MPLIRRHDCRALARTSNASGKGAERHFEAADIAANKHQRAASQHQIIDTPAIRSFPARKGSGVASPFLFGVSELELIFASHDSLRFAGTEIQFIFVAARRLHEPALSAHGA